MTTPRNDWQDKRVLVTGAGGFIGSHLAEELVRRGARVRALVRYNSQGTFGWLSRSDEAIARQIEFVQGDLRDADSVSRAVRGREVVFHLGAMISIPYSFVAPNEAVAVNVGGTQNVLNACREHGVARMIHTSTSEVYGTAIYVPIDEKHPLQGQSPYSASKIGADHLVDSYFRTFDLPATTVRPFNTFGPRQSARAVIPTILVQLLSGRKVKLGNLNATRDFTFVTDTVEGMLMAAQSQAAVGRTMNLGTRNEIKIGDLLQLLGELTGVAPELEIEDARIRPEKSEVNRLLSENQLAGELIGWKPKVSLRDGLAETLSWFLGHLEYYRRAQQGYVI
jgi:dTDP-glucose 4,6-dehydratase